MMSKTSTAVKQRWMAKAYHRYTISLRHDTDSDIIDYIERHKAEGTTDLIRQLLREAIEARTEETSRGD